MTTLIIGCGYLGQRLGARLRQQGERVFGTVRSPGRAAVIAGLGIEPVIADVLAPDSLADCRRPSASFIASGLTEPPDLPCGPFTSTACRMSWIAAAFGDALRLRQLDGRLRPDRRGVGR